MMYSLGECNETTVGFVVTNCFVCHCAGLGSRLLKTLYHHFFIIQIIGKQIAQDTASSFLHHPDYWEADC
jgi:hypothetical protein